MSDHGLVQPGAIPICITVKHGQIVVVRQLYQTATHTLDQRKWSGRNVDISCFWKDACKGLNTEVEYGDEVGVEAQTAVRYLLIHLALVSLRFLERFRSRL